MHVPIVTGVMHSVIVLCIIVAMTGVKGLGFSAQLNVVVEEKDIYDEKVRNMTKGRSRTLAGKPILRKVT